MKSLSNIEIVILVFGVGAIGYFVYSKIADLKEDIENLNPF